MKTLELRVNSAAPSGLQTMLIFATVFLALLALATLARLFVPDLLATFSPDSIVFEEEARRLALRIAEEGWSVWVPAPNEQTPIGLVAASMAVFGDTLVPIIILNAALIAAAAAAVVHLVSRLLADPRLAVVGTAAFLLPSIVMVTAVPHKDPFAIFGAAFVILGLLSCARFGSSGGNTRLLVGLAMVALGAGAFWYVRPYGTVLMLGAAAVFTSVLLFGLGAMLVKRRGGALTKAARTFAALVLAVVVLFLISRAPTVEGLQETSAFRSERSLSTSSLAPAAIDVLEKSGTVGAPSSAPAPIDFLATPASPGAQCPIGLPAELEARLGFLLATRQGFISCCADAATAIDIDRDLVTSCDLVAYLPRAMAIGHLAPFPSDWFEPGRSIIAAFSVAAEMSLVYLGLAGVFVGLWYGRTREAIAIVAFCVGLMVVLAVAFPNIGTLYRMRLPYLLPLLAFGLSALATALFARKG